MTPWPPATMPLTVDVEYRRRADYLTRQFHRSALPVETVLDLACGTGTMACLLAERGYRMIAVDGSEEMLTQAAWKAAALEQPPMFLHQSMPRLHLGMEVDAAISTLDALNYLTRTADLRETLRRVYRWLRPGGLFLFDVNTPYKLRRMDGQVYLDETEDSYCVWRTFYAPGRKICTYQVDLFRLNANGSWDRAFEEHRERAWGAGGAGDVSDGGGLRRCHRHRRPHQPSTGGGGGPLDFPVSKAGQTKIKQEFVQ